MSVKVFIVMAPPEPDKSGPETSLDSKRQTGSQWQAERMVFVKDGFSLPALLIPVLWLFWHRMWLPLLGFLAYMVALSGIELMAGQLVSTVIATGFAILFGLEANNLRRWSLAAKGWQTVGEVVGRNCNEAEFLFFRDWANRSKATDLASGAAMAENHSQTADRSSVARAAQNDPDDEPSIFGLFPEPER